MKTEHKKQQDFRTGSDAHNIPPQPSVTGKQRFYTNIFEHAKYGFVLYGGAWANNSREGIIESAKSCGLEVTEQITLKFYLPALGHTPKSEYKLR